MYVLFAEKTCPDSDLAKKFFCAPTKTEAIVTSALAPYSIDSTLKSFKENNIAYYAISTDGSNHDGLKLFLLRMQYFNRKNGDIQSKLIEFTSKPNVIADTIAGYRRDTLEKIELSKKCVAFTGDNCYTILED